MTALRVSRGAFRELEAIFEYLAADAPSAAKGFERRLSEIFYRIRQYPLSGRLTDIPDVRCSNTNPYPFLVFYRIQPHLVTIVAIRHGARNPRSMPARPRKTMT
jgi:plasmid stabilization system protein ParE